MHGPLLTGTDLRFQVKEGAGSISKKNKIQTSIHIVSDNSRNIFKVIIKKLKLCE